MKADTFSKMGSCEQALEALSAVFEHAPIVMVLVDREGHVERMNHLGILATGKTEEGVLGRLGGEVFSCVNASRGGGCGKNAECKSCALRNTFTKTFQTGENLDRMPGEMIFVRDGVPSKHDILISTTSFAIADGRKVLVSIDDITDLKELERLRDNLTHMIVHDMRSPLTGIAGFLDLALRNREADDKTSRFLVTARESANMLTEMVTELLDVSRLEAGEMPLEKEECDLREPVSKAIESLGGLVADRDVQAIYPDKPVSVSCDPTIVRRVVANLVANAVKFTPKDGSVRIEVAEQPGSTKIAVTDTGPGIDPEYHGKIFDKFGQVEARQHGKMYSTGLGLTFCKLAVEAHGGAIGLESEIGKGSTFWFSLPRRAS